ncbi:MAG: DUF3418 domain-containing protein [Tepidisphaeraceae bacterium]
MPEPSEKVAPPQPPVLPPARAEAVHRALLSGLLGHVGTRGDAPHEYQGVGNRRFHLFPGSGQFHRKPPWVMAAELVETTRLYARTVASIKPEWVERAAPQLVKRTYTDPRWSRAQADVFAYEKVTFQGLTLVPRRSVQYGPIDARASREVFIHHALVLGDYDTDAPYFRHNRDLVREVELLEAKLRRHDLLADAKARFAFYDARMPRDVYNGRLFERWRQGAELRDKRLLFMRRQDLLMTDVSATGAAEQFPDAITVNGIHVPLKYVFDPGHEADGVTTVVPLAALNQLPAEPFEWLVPGWLKEKVVRLIKSLPKQLRVSFVPAPDYADEIVPKLRYREGSLRHALAWQLGRATGVQVPFDAWQPGELEPWLRMNFEVTDKAGKTIATGRDLDQIRKDLRVELTSAFNNLPPGKWNRGGLTKWDFDDVPEKVEVERHGMTVVGYPAIVDEGASVALRLVETPERAQALSRGGVRRLFIIEYSPTIQYELRDAPKLREMCLHYAPLGSCQKLKDDLTTVAADRVFLGDALDVRTQMEFELRLESSWNRLRPIAFEVAELAAQVLENFHAVSKRLSEDFPPLLLPAVSEMRAHLKHLMPADFLLRTPFAWLQHLPRYLKAVDVRLTKLKNAGLSRDVAASQQVAPLWQQYLKRAQKHAAERVYDPELALYRWMLEELRVSLFAQELKTSMPVSTQRLEKQWAAVKA